jgi:hypothetical protein
MSTTVEIDGVTLVPIREAALRVKYSHDYVSRLAREGKIVASQVGRKWFVDPVSLKNFSAEAEVLETVRKEELRQERKRELMAKEALALLDQQVAARATKQRFDAYAVTAAAVCLGLLVGVGVYTVNEFTGNKFVGSTFSAPAALSGHEVATVAGDGESPFRIIDEPKDVLVTTIVETPVFAEVSEVRPMMDKETGSGIVLFAEGEIVDEESVAAMFSDPVEVTFDGEQAGTVLYENEDGEVSEYPFIRIPASHDKEVTEGAE